jgi:hypothetical protein
MFDIHLEYLKPNFNSTPTKLMDYGVTKRREFDFLKLVFKTFKYL